MGDAADRSGDDVDGAHHAGRKLIEDSRFQPGNSIEARMVGGSRGEVDARAPSLVQGVGRRVDHTRKHFDALQLAHQRHRQDRLDRSAQAFLVDGSGEAAGEPDGRLLEGS